jgi:hypothetical protein
MTLVRFNSDNSKNNGMIPGFTDVFDSIINELPSGGSFI